MKKLLFFIMGLFCYVQLAEAQPYARHFWLNQQSVNYTLSTPTSAGEWILAAARPELQQDSTTARKNTIAVFRLDNAAYAILTDTIPSACADSVSVIGMLGTNGEFDKEVDFEVHCVVQSCNPDTNYILCGTISMDTSQQPVGMVAVLDAQLNLVSLRQYEDIKVFYSVYARDSFYYVCGQAQNGIGIVLRDNLANAPSPQMRIKGFQTANTWAHHKIIAREIRGTRDTCYEICVSGSNGIDTIGWSVFIICRATLGYSNAQMFPPAHPINSNTTIAYYYSTGSNPPAGLDVGLLLSASSGQEILTYVFNNNQSFVMDTAFRIPWVGKLEDMDYGGDTLPYRIAWVGNNTQAVPQAAEYIRTDMPTLSSASIISFTPPDSSAYYSLHKMHYFVGDKQFHASGYYHNYNDSNDHLNDRATFVVTPELVVNSCVNQKSENIIGINTIEQTGIFMATIFLEGNELEILTKKYRFCTMDCEGNEIIINK